MDQRIVCAANKFVDQCGQLYIVLGIRHYDTLMNEAIRRLPPGMYEKEQGFVDQYGNFLTREEAHVVALKANQITQRCGGDDNRLFSENLY